MTILLAVMFFGFLNPASAQVAESPLGVLTQTFLSLDRAYIVCREKQTCEDLTKERDAAKQALDEALNDKSKLRPAINAIREFREAMGR